MAKREPNPYFEVRKSPIQGKGVFAVRRIRKGTRVAEYEGEHISSREAMRRYDDLSMKRHHTFLFDLDGKTCIDGAVGGNDSRFINHSCEPNCEAVQEGRRIFVVALQTIEPDEELTYDYRYVVEGPIDATLRRLYACRCGTPSCRGTIVQPELLATGKEKKKPVDVTVVRNSRAARKDERVGPAEGRDERTRRRTGSSARA